MSQAEGSQTKWYALTAEDVAKQLKVDPPKGLSAAEAQQRLQKYGPNRLADKKKESGWQAFLRQYKDFMQIILLVAALINIVFTREWGTTIVLVVLTVFNAVLGLRGESKAEASLAALAGTMKNIARVRRDGVTVEIDAEQVVPGDIVLMEAGDLVPADGRLFVAATLEIEEAALTGESVATLKDTAAITNPTCRWATAMTWRFMNTGVTRGRGEMIVTTTGMGTEMGNIATLLNQTESDKTPLAEAARPADDDHCGAGRPRFHPDGDHGAAQRADAGRHLHRRRGAGRLGHPDRPAGRRHHHVFHGRADAGNPGRHRQAAAVGRDAGLGLGHLLRQDRHADAQQDDVVELTIPGHNHYKVTGEGYSPEGKLLHDSGAQIDLTPSC